MRIGNMQMRFYSALLLSMYVVVAFSGCQPDTAKVPPDIAKLPPKPISILAKTDSGVTCTLLKWEAGLTVLVADRLGDGGWRGTEVTVSPGQSYVWSATMNNPNSSDQVLKWIAKTLDGANGRFEVDGRQYDLNDGTVFLFEPTGTNVGVRQLNLDLSDIMLTQEALISFAKDKLDDTRF